MLDQAASKSLITAGRDAGSVPVTKNVAQVNSINVRVKQVSGRPLSRTVPTVYCCVAPQVQKGTT